MKNKASWIGGIGTGVTAVCCFTSVLVIALTGLGAVAIIDYLDYVLFPLLFFFIALTGYGIYRNQQAKQNCELPDNQKTEE